MWIQNVYRRLHMRPETLIGVNARYFCKNQTDKIHIAESSASEMWYNEPFIASTVASGRCREVLKIIQTHVISRCGLYAPLDSLVHLRTFGQHTCEAADGCRRDWTPLTVLNGLACAPNKTLVSPLPCGAAGLREGLLVGMLLGMDLVIQKFVCQFLSTVNLQLHKCGEKPDVADV